MKKTATILMAVLLVFSFAGCKAKEPMTLEAFTTIAEAQGLQVTDLSATEEVTGSYAVAMPTDSAYMIEFLIFEDEPTANILYNTVQTTFESAAGSSSSTSSVNMPGNRSYKLTSSGQYYHVAQIQNTVIAVSAPTENKEAVQEVMKALGY